MRTLIIIPAYNEAKSLPALFDALKKAPVACDIVVINDCSTDDTEAVCKAHGVRVISLPVNLGIGGAVQTGYRYAWINGYDAAVQMDGDGQHDPRFLKLLLSRIEEGYDLCIGSRFIENEGFQSSVARRIGIRYFSWLIHFMTGHRFSDPTSGYRACSRGLIGMFAREYPKDYPEPETIVAAHRNKFKITEVPVIMKPRKEGTSSITNLKAIYYMIKVSLAIAIASIRKGGSA